MRKRQSEGGGEEQHRAQQGAREQEREQGRGRKERHGTREHANAREGARASTRAGACTVIFKHIQFVYNVDLIETYVFLMIICFDYYQSKFVYPPPPEHGLQTHAAI